MTDVDLSPVFERVNAAMEGTGYAVDSVMETTVDLAGEQRMTISLSRNYFDEVNRQSLVPWAKEAGQ